MVHSKQNFLSLVSKYSVASLLVNLNYQMKMLKDTIERKAATNILQSKSVASTYKQ